jgi:hypothetical protein
MLHIISLPNQIVSLMTALAVLLTGSSAACRADAVVPPYADELPATTGICIWSDNARHLADQWQKTALFQAYAAEPMRPFWSDLRKKREGLLPHERLGLSWQDLARVSAGTWVLARDFGSDGQGTLLIVDVRGREAAADSVLGTVETNWKDRGMSVRQQSYPWGKVSVATRPDAQRWAFVHDSRLYLTDRLSLATSLFARRDGKTIPSLSSAAIYRTLSERTSSGPQGSLQFFVDPWRLAQYAGGATSVTTRQRLEFLERHGFRALEAITGHVIFHPDAHDLEFTVQVLAKFPLADAAALLSFASSQDFGLAPLVPADAVGVTCLHWDLKSAFKAYGCVYDDVYGEDYAGAFDDLLHNIAEDPDGPQVDLRTELFDTLQGKISHAYDYRGPITNGNATGRRDVWMAESVAPERSTQALAKFFLNDPDVTSSSVQGVQIWHSRSDGPLLGSDPDNPLPIPADALCIARSHFVLATDRQLLREMAEQGATDKETRVTHAFSPRTWQAASAIPQVAQSWRNLVPVAQAAHACIRQQRLPSEGSWPELLLWFLVSTETPRGRELAVDGALLPPFSTIQHRFGLELMEICVQPQGWLVHGRLTRPEP